MLSAITFTIAAVSAQWNYPSTNPGCMQNPYAYGCQSGQFFPPQIPQIPQCLPTMVGCPGQLYLAFFTTFPSVRLQTLTQKHKLTIV